jgi:hypothetical protein
LIPSLQSLSQKLSASRIALDNPESLQRFASLLNNHFPHSFGTPCGEEMEEEDIMAVDTAPQRRDMRYYDSEEGEEDDDEDGPVMVAEEDIQASLERSSGASNPRNDIPFEVQSRYPLLLAAIQDHEDILMTCARALDEKKDVSLVREAAAYLEETELRKF